MLVEYIKDFGESTEKILCSYKISDATDRWDRAIEDYTYNKLLELNTTYDFVDWENAPSITEVIYDDTGKIVDICDCIDLYYNL